MLTALVSRQDPDLPELTVSAGKYEHNWFIDRRSTERLQEPEEVLQSHQFSESRPVP